MSFSSSIFQKLCPGCASSVAIGLARCNCGHVFESATNSLSPLEQSLRDEELYEGYLAARAEQSRQAALTADEALAEDRSNPDLMSAAALSHEVAKSIESDLAEQRKKLSAIRAALRDLQPAAPVAPAVAAEPPAATRSNKAAMLPKPAKSQATRGKPAASVTAPLPVAKEKTRPVTAKNKPASDTVWQASTAQKAAGALAAIKNAKIREAIARSQQAKVEVVIKAEQSTAPAAKSSPSTTVAPSEFRKEQASKAEKIMQVRMSADGKECPNCTSSVPVNTTRCQCGFAFVSGGTELPSLTLCTGDFTALRNSFKLNLRS